MDINQQLLQYIRLSPTAFHACATTAARLVEEGYEELLEIDTWSLKPGGKYFVQRNGSSLIAFRIPDTAFPGFMITASHGDSPCFKIKEHAELKDNYYIRLSTERYGGMLYAPWLDRPLSIAGRVSIAQDHGIGTRLVDLKEPCAIIPNVAIHMNRKANDGFAPNPAVDLLPLWSASSSGDTLRTRIAKILDVDESAILSTDLYLYNAEAGYTWNDFVSAPRLDDLQCAFAALTAFLSAEPSECACVYCLFDNEEVGSETRQGAASTFLHDTLSRICDAMHCDLREKIAGSFLASCDNAHAIHPNHPEYADKNHTVTLNGGVVIKYNANQKYTTDALSSAILKYIARCEGLSLQEYSNRADMAGGSTLGNISNTQVSLCSADIGCAQLAMHSCFETTGIRDTEQMILLLRSLYRRTLHFSSGNNFYIS